MRYREKQNNLTEDIFDWQQNSGSSITGWDTGGQTGYISEQRYIAMLDVVTQDWKRKLAMGQIINNPMLSQTYFCTQVPAIIELKGHFADYPAPNNWYTYVDGVALPPAFGATSLDWDWFDEYLKDYENGRDIALAQAWANVDISEMQALATLGELPETLRWMASLYKRMISLLELFSRKRLKLAAVKLLGSRRRIADEVFELWMELRYAVRPLVFDMKQAVEAWNAKVKKSNRITARGFHREEEVNLSTYDFDFSWYQSTVSRVSTVSSDFRSGVLFQIDNDVNEIMSIFGLDQPLETVWELIPFSFIIDWFFSVGNVISSWTANPACTPLASWTTETHTIRTIDTLSGATPNIFSGYNLVVDELEVSQVGRTITTRILKRRCPSPKRAILPKFNLRLDTAKLVDLAIIGRNIFRKM